MKKVNPGKTYMLQYEPDEGYYSARNTEIGGEVLMLMMDGKLAMPPIDLEVPEDELLLRDGTEPEVEQRFRHVCFTVI